MTKRPPSDEMAAFRAAIDDLLGGQPFRTRQDAERQIEAEVRSYNLRPQKELGGLSPDQMYRLLNSDWGRSGPLTVAAPTDPNEFGEPDFLFNARALLSTLRDDGPAKVTQAGNLSREFVALMLARMRWRDGDLEELRQVSKAINESDIRPLEILRYVLVFAGLIHRRKGFRITSLGQQLLEDGRSGDLFVLLFLTFFKQLDLRAVSAFGGHEGLQQTLAFVFWKVRTEAKSWVTPKHLADAAWMETAKDLPPPTSTPELFFDGIEWTFRSRVIEPLVKFGLLEARSLPAKERWERPIELRKTPLYDRVLQFEFGRP